ncbi:hypothetical protein CERSUDRAFT_76925 [Gelatoporia subvermispora B]|uniref:Uncharacterized protein n=1 Tax=Ceriporiopsis subvermispora (strain B) TaxID=914234 RepID=M2R4X5_CERS8|nr:hypothetical protein CERSUDRAFT_76925 [Gelatoporia subvermispora B]
MEDLKDTEHLTDSKHCLPLPVSSVAPSVEAEKTGTRTKRRLQFMPLLYAFGGALLLAACLRTIMKRRTTPVRFTFDSFLCSFPAYDVVHMSGYLESHHKCIDKALWMKSRKPRLRAEALFKLPLASDVLHLVSRGSIQHGQVHVVSPGYASGDPESIAVRIFAEYTDEAALDRVSICLGHPDENQHGIEIISPQDLDDYSDGVNLTIIIIIPPGSSWDVPTRVNSLNASMPNFGFEFGNLEDSVWFDSLTLSSSGRPINSKSLAVGHAAIHASNASIQGRFMVSDSLNLNTSNAPISAELQVLHDEGASATEISAYTVFDGFIELKTVRLNTTLGRGGTRPYMIDIRSIDARPFGAVDTDTDLTWDIAPEGYIRHTLLRRRNWSHLMWSTIEQGSLLLKHSPFERMLEGYHDHAKGDVGLECKKMVLRHIWYSTLYSPTEQDLASVEMKEWFAGKGRTVGLITLKISDISD